MTQEQLNDIIEDIMTSTYESGRNKILSFATRMCAKQKGICEQHALITSIFDSTGNKYNDKDLCVDGYTLYINRESILNAPYPEELQ